MEIHVIAPHYSPRLKYIVNFICGDLLGFDVRFGAEESAMNKEVMTIHYGGSFPASAKIKIPAHPFLERNDLVEPAIEVSEVDGLPAFFQLSAVTPTQLPFDIFAMSFYLLSRFEEYSATAKRDEHQRFPAGSSLAFRYDFLQQPLIDQWAWRLYAVLRKQYPNCPERKPCYQFLPTIDVDFAWAYQHKGWRRACATFFKNFITIQLQRVKKQMAILLNQQKDPYDTYDFLNEVHTSNAVKALFFILMGDYGGFDKSNPPKTTAMRLLIRKLARQNQVGIHPSYKSNNSITTLEVEKKALENILGEKITQSRQHFLKLSFPDTYHQLLKMEIARDYSMGYADAVGFRASTAYSFNWYDLKSEQETPLRVTPFEVMDVTLKNYLQLNPKTASELCTKIINRTRETGGTFCLLWHNSSFSVEMGWEDWAGFYEKLVALAVQNNVIQDQS